MKKNLPKDWNWSTASGSDGEEEKPILASQWKPHTHTHTQMKIGRNNGNLIKIDFWSLSVIKLFDRRNGGSILATIAHNCQFQFCIIISQWPPAQCISLWPIIVGLRHSMGFFDCNECVSGNKCLYILPNKSVTFVSATTTTAIATAAASVCFCWDSKSVLNNCQFLVCA